MIDHRLWQIAGWTMLHYLWVGAAMGSVALLARHGMRSATPSVRYLFALGSLLLLSVAPAAIALVVMQNLPTEDRVPSPITDSASGPETTHLEDIRPTMAVADGEPAIENSQSWRNEQLLAALNAAVTRLPWLWICGAPLSFALTTVGLFGAERLRRQSRLLEDARITEMCRELVLSLKISFRVSVAICDRIAAPILVGVFRPMILLPAAALAGWDPQQLEMMLLHELAHVRRYDNLINLLQRLTESLLFFQPMVWIMSGWARQEREHCCDALVVARTRQPHAYAEILVNLAETLPQNALRSSSFAHSQAVSSMAERPLMARVRRILKKEEQSMQVSRKAIGLALVGLLVLAVMVGGYYSRPSYANDSSFWILPKDYAPSTHVAHARRGDFGRFMLEKGLVLKGRVVDVDGKPLPNVWVNAGILRGSAKKSLGMAVFDHLARAALSNQKGEFVMAPLPAGVYNLIVAEDGKMIPGFQAKLKYMAGRYLAGEYLLNGKPAGDVRFVNQADGRWRSTQLLPDEEFTLTVEAPGYEPKSEDLKLSEGAVKELQVTLRPVDPKANDESNATSGEKLASGKAWPHDSTPILARMSSNTIVESDVAGDVNRLLEKYKGKIPPDQLEKQRQSLVRQRLKNLIDTKLIWQDAKDAIPSEAWTHIEANLDKQFEDVDLKKMMKKEGVASRHELDQKLRSLGTSLEQEKRASLELTLARQWIGQQVKRDQEITPDQMLLYYRTHPKEFTSLARAQWEELMVRYSKHPTRAAARDAITRLGDQVRAGRPFADVAKADSDGPDAAKGGQRDWTEQGASACRALDTALFNLPLGQLSPIIESDHGFHIIRVTRRDPEVVKPFLDAQAKIKKRIIHQRMEKQFQEYMAKLQAKTPVWTIFDVGTPGGK